MLKTRDEEQRGGDSKADEDEGSENQGREGMTHPSIAGSHHRLIPACCCWESHRSSACSGCTLGFIFYPAMLFCPTSSRKPSQAAMLGDGLSTQAWSYTSGMIHYCASTLFYK